MNGPLQERSREWIWWWPHEFGLLGSLLRSECRANGYRTLVGMHKLPTNAASSSAIANSYLDRCMFGCFLLMCTKHFKSYLPWPWIFQESHLMPLSWRSCALFHKSPWTKWSWYMAWTWQRWKLWIQMKRDPWSLRRWIHFIEASCV